MGCRQCVVSVVQLKGKHCQKKPLLKWSCRYVWALSVISERSDCSRISCEGREVQDVESVFEDTRGLQGKRGTGGHMNKNNTLWKKVNWKWHTDNISNYRYQPHLKKPIKTIPEPIHNSHTMGCQQCLSLRFVQLKGKHCRKPHCSNGVVDTVRKS